MSISNIKLLSNHQIDKVRWDQTIEQSINGLAYAYSWYLDATFPSWYALISDDYSYVFPITSNRKFGFYYWFSPIYTMQLGIFSKNELTNEIIKQFYDNFPTNIVSFDFSLNSNVKLVPDRFTFTINTCQFVDLSISYSEIIQDYSSNLKRNLKKATKENLRIIESNDIESVVNMFRDNRGVFIKNTSENDYIILHKLINNTLNADKGKIFQVYLHTELVASCFFSFTNNRIIYHKGGVNDKGKKNGAMHFLIDQIIQKYSSNNLILDFGGSSIQNVKQFNNNFSKKEYTYLQLSKGNSVINSLRKFKNKLF